MKKENSYSHILKYTGLLGGVQVLHILISACRNKVTALFIGSAGMGWSDLFARTVELMAGATNFGIGFSAIRRLSVLYETGDMARTGRYVRLVRSWVLLTGLFGMGLTLLLAPLLSLFATGSPDRTVQFALLAPAILLATLLGGEIAVLKGTHRLRPLAAASALSALATLLLTAPIYFRFGAAGILPVLLSTGTAVFLIHLHAATRLFPYRVRLHPWRYLRRGSHLLRLGTAYIAAGIAGSGAEMLIRTVLMKNDESQAGLYAAGLTLTVSYARFVFVAMDADYFPRLSALMDDKKGLSVAVNRQTDALVLLMTPVLLLLALSLPLVVRILYTEEFTAVIPMVLCALPYMFFKAVYSPLSYLALSGGDSRLYLVMELAYNAVLAAAVITGFRAGGLAGAGIGLSLANLSDLLLILTFYPRRYSVRLKALTVRRTLRQFLLLAAGLVCISRPEPEWHWGGGCGFTLLSAVLSWQLLKSETGLNNRLRSLWKKVPRNRQGRNTER